MIYILDIRLDDQHYNAIIHFVTTFTAKSQNDAQLLVDELVEAFKRKEAKILFKTYYQVSDDPVEKVRQLQYYQFMIKRATADIKIEQFIVDNPDQTKSLFDNLAEKLFNGEQSTAQIGRKYNIPVRVTNKEDQEPIASDLFYYNLEHLIPKSN